PTLGGRRRWRVRGPAPGCAPERSGFGWRVLHQPRGLVELDRAPGEEGVRVEALVVSESLENLLALGPERLVAPEPDHEDLMVGTGHALELLGEEHRRSLAGGGGIVDPVHVR